VDQAQAATQSVHRSPEQGEVWKAFALFHDSYSRRLRRLPPSLQAENGAGVFGPPYIADELHLGRAGIGKTGAEPGMSEGFEQYLRAIHNQ
jgi:hypothetical protein